MNSRVTAVLLLFLVTLALSALPGAPRRTEAADRPTSQVIIDAKIVSVEQRELMDLGLDWYRPSQRISEEDRVRLRGFADAARESDEIALSALDGDSAFAATDRGRLIRGGLVASLFQNDLALALLATEKRARAKQISKPIVRALCHDVSTIALAQGRSRFPDSKKGLKEAGRCLDALRDFFPVLTQLGLPRDYGAIFENFDGKPRRTIQERIGLTTVEPLKLRFGRNGLRMAGAGKEPHWGYSQFASTLPDDFTLLITVELPKKVGRKGRDALDGAISVLELDSDTGSPPSSFVVLGNQLTSDGFAQSYVATRDGNQHVIPHPFACPKRSITNVIVKDGETVTVGGLFIEDDDSTSTWSRQVPVLGDMPFLGLGMFGSKSTKLEFRNLMIFLAPHTVDLDED